MLSPPRRPPAIQPLAAAIGSNRQNQGHIADERPSRVRLRASPFGVPRAPGGGAAASTTPALMASPPISTPTSKATISSQAQVGRRWCETQVDVDVLRLSAPKTDAQREEAQGDEGSDQTHDEGLGKFHD